MALKVQAGQLRDRVTFQRNTPTTNARGAEVPSWANLASVPTVWGWMQSTPGSENVRDNLDVAVNRFTLIVRWRTDLTPEDRAVWHASGGDRVLAIEDLGDPDGTRQWLQLSLFAVVGETEIG